MDVQQTQCEWEDDFGLVLHAGLEAPDQQNGDGAHEDFEADLNDAVDLPAEELCPCKLVKCRAVECRALHTQLGQVSPTMSHGASRSHCSDVATTKPTMETGMAIIRAHVSLRRKVPRVTSRRRKKITESLDRSREMM